jgi:hypothetical protein
MLRMKLSMQAVRSLLFATLVLAMPPAASCAQIGISGHDSAAMLR